MNIKFIYHTDTSISGGVSPFDEAIHQVSSSEELVIACPYIDIDYIEPFLNKCKNWRIVSDIEAWLSAFQGKSRERIINFIMENKFQIHHYKNLHAKVILGEHSCLVGSANFTRMGVTERVEMSILLDEKEHINEIRIWFEKLWVESGEIDLLELQKYAKVNNDIQLTDDSTNSCIKSIAPVIKAKTRHELETQKLSKDIAKERKQNPSIPSERRAYRDKDFDGKFWNIVEEAKVLWSRKVDEHIKKNGDQGFFATLGAGIYIFYLPPRHKIPKRKEILSPPPAAYGKALHYMSIANEVVKFIRSKGIDCFYDPGRDD